MSDKPRITLYSTYISSTQKLVHDIRRCRDLLEAKAKGCYDEVDVGDEANAEKKEEMAKVSGTKVLPQVHFMGKNIGGWDALEEINEMGQFNEVFGAALSK